MTVEKHWREKGGRRRAGATARPWEETQAEAAGASAATPAAARGLFGNVCGLPADRVRGRRFRTVSARPTIRPPHPPAPAYRDGGSGGPRVTAKVTKGHSRFFSVISVPAFNIKQKE